jgi:outer membrane protein assembly factor BamB
MTFPSNPNDNDIHTAFGRRLKYKSSTSTWEVVSSPSVAIETESPVANTAVSSSSDLPLTGNEIGAMSYSQDTNTLYVWNGTGWFKIALVNTNPTITDGGQATYELNGDGTPTVITLVANDPEGLPLTWSYAVSSGALEDTTISNTGAVFTITPGATAATFNLTFTASDGVNIDTSVSSFTLSFADWSAATLAYTLDNPNAYGSSASDLFGRFIAISDNYAIVGAFLEDDAGGTDSGKAYIYNVTTGALVHTLDNPNPDGVGSDDNFGRAVAIDGNSAIVSAYGEDEAGRTDSGKAYIFNVTTGALLHTLDNPNAYSTSTSDYFGYSVAISGNYAIVGTINEDDAGGNNSGKAYIFNVTTGALVHTLDNPNAYGTSQGDNFGWAVAISGNYAIVGAWFEHDAGGINSGKVYIFDVSTGALVHTLDNPNAYGTSASDYFGNSVAISGNYVIVGAHGEADSGGYTSGKAYIFNVTTGALLHTLDNPNAYDTSANDYFGYSVAVSGDYAIVGAFAEDDAGGTNSGKVYIFDVTTGALLKTLDNPNAYDTSAGDQIGIAVAISGKYAVISAHTEDEAGGTNSGKAYVFQAG